MSDWTNPVVGYWAYGGDSYNGGVQRERYHNKSRYIACIRVYGHDREVGKTYSLQKAQALVEIAWMKHLQLTRDFEQYITSIGSLRRVRCCKCLDTKTVCKKHKRSVIFCWCESGEQKCRACKKPKGTKR